MIYPDTKLELACAKKDSRYYLMTPWLDSKGPDPLVVATDGHIIAALPAEILSDDVDGMVPLDAIKASRDKSNAFLQGGCSITLTESSAEMISGQSFPRSNGETFPDHTVVFKDHAARNEKCDILLDVAMLKRLADALHDRKGNKVLGMRLWFGKNPDGTIDGCKSVYMEPKLADDESDLPLRKGVLMPIRDK